MEPRVTIPETPGTVGNQRRKSSPVTQSLRKPTPVPILTSITSLFPNQLIVGHPTRVSDGDLVQLHSRGETQYPLETMMNNSR